MNKKSTLLLTFLVLALGWSGAASAQLLARYEFEQASPTDVLDSSPKGNHATFENLNAETAGGEPNWVDAGAGLGQTLGFDGNLRVVMPAENMGLRSDRGAVAFWMNLGPDMSGINTIWWGGDNITGGGFGPENEMHIHVEAAAGDIWTGGELAFHGQNSPSNFHLNTDPNKDDADPTWTGGPLEQNAGSPPLDPILLNDATWHHVACTWGNRERGFSTVKLYLDGALIHEGNQGSRNYPLSNMYWGSMANNSRAYSGLLDDVQIYGRPLTLEEVQGVMADSLAYTYEASQPSPANLITETMLDATCRWTEGDAVATHNVYFSTSFADVNAATPDDPRNAWVGQNQLDATYDPEGLAYNTTYYWRVDEVEADGTTIHRGTVWQFTTRNFIVVDDFEAYDINDVGGNRIFDVWTDGWLNPETNGAVVGYATLDDGDGNYSETINVHSGLQAMPLAFNTDYKYSEATLPLSGDLANWAVDDVTELSLWFMGYQALTGNSSEAEGVHTITSSGADIWGGWDECHFVYKEITGGTTIIARVDSLTNANPFAKAGIMIRESLDPGSKNCAVYVTPENGTRYQGRTVTDDPYLGAGETTPAFFDPNDPAFVPPNWLKIEWSTGGIVRASHSYDGSTWTKFNPPFTDVCQMARPIYVGLAVTSHDTTLVTEAQISAVSITGPGNDGPWMAQDIGILNNPPEPLYVAINGKPAVYHSDPNAARINTWTEWNIPLQRFADQGVDMSNVSELALGVGIQKDVLTPGRPGQLFIDDIRLNRPAASDSLAVQDDSGNP